MITIFRRVAATALIAACSGQNVTTPRLEQDPDLSGHYRSALNIIVDSAGGGFLGVLLNVQCPAAWALTQTRPREYAVTIQFDLAACVDNWGHAAAYLTLGSTLTGVLRISTVTWLASSTESLGTIVVGKGGRQELQDITGCSASGVDTWNLMFQVYTRPDHSIENGGSYFQSLLPVPEQGYFRAQCHQSVGVFLQLGFPYFQRAE